jgi:hypothetical protein
VRRSIVHAGVDPACVAVTVCVGAADLDLATGEALAGVRRDRSAPRTDVDRDAALLAARARPAWWSWCAFAMA